WPTAETPNTPTRAREGTDMSTVATASASVLKTEGRLFVREPGTLFWVLAFPPLLLLAFGLIPGYHEANPDLGGRRAIEFYVPGTIMVALITASLQAMPATLTSYRERGILRRMRTTPARPADLLIAQMVLHASAALLTAEIVMALGRLVFGVIHPKSCRANLTTLAIDLLEGLPMGVLHTTVTRTVKVANAVGL